MKKLIYLVSLTTLGIFLIFLYAGCSEESPIATTVAHNSSHNQLPQQPQLLVQVLYHLELLDQYANTRVATLYRP